MQETWNPVLVLDKQKNTAAGSQEAHCMALARGADLKIETNFRHNEHIDTSSDDNDLIVEVCEFPLTYVIDGKWSAGIMTLRQPVSLPNGFGPRPSMSFFMYNQDGTQGIARPYLDGISTAGKMSLSDPEPPSGMAGYHMFDNWDKGTNAEMCPSEDPKSGFAKYSHGACRRICVKQLACGCFGSAMYQHIWQGQL